MTKGTKIPRNAQSGKFVLGERAFRKISAVEGIKPSKRLSVDLAHLRDLPAEERRLILSNKYGRKKA